MRKEKCSCFFGNFLCNLVYASDSIYNPDVVSDADFAVFSYIPFKKTLFFGFFDFLKVRIICICKKLSEICFNVVGMNRFAAFYIFCCMADRKTVFYNIFAAFNVAKRRFMTCGKIYFDIVVRIYNHIILLSFFNLFGKE